MYTSDASLRMATNALIHERACNKLLVATTTVEQYPPMWRRCWTGVLFPPHHSYRGKYPRHSHGALGTTLLRIHV